MRLLLHDSTLQLDNALPVEERMILAQNIIDENPLDFEMTGHSVADHKVKIRLDVLGTYILNSVKDIRTDVMSRYKEKNRPYQEISISNLVGHNAVKQHYFSHNKEAFGKN